MGYAPRIPFRQGLEETVRWYADNRAWWEPLKRTARRPPPPGRAAIMIRWLVTGAGGCSAPTWSLPWPPGRAGDRADPPAWT